MRLLIKCPTQFYSWASFDVNPHPQDLPIWPLVFITIACGALSGFHSTQSPMMARCLKNESEGRFVFYGAMVAEGVIGLVWVTIGMTFYPDATSLLNAIKHGGPANVVYESSYALLGTVGGLIAILGVLALPITSGDTAFRAARLIIAEELKIGQIKKSNRLYIALPVFFVGIILTNVDFGIIWRYFGWCNQCIATMVFWSASVYLYKHGRFHYIASIPACFVTYVAIVYMLFEPTMGIRLNVAYANTIAVIATAVIYFLYLKYGKSHIFYQDKSTKTQD